MALPPQVDERSKQAGPGAGARPDARGGSRRWVLPAVVLLLAVATGAILIATSSGRGHSQPLAGGARGARSANFDVSQPPAGGAQSASFDGNELTQLKAAPNLGGLHNYLGGPPVNLASFRGKAVLVTFLYTHCPTDCPLIASHLSLALDQLGANASKVQVIAVSVDPRGDNRRTVAAFLKAHDLTGRALYLTGTLHELARVWQGWGVGAERDASDPELINHSALVYGVDGSGRRRTVYLGGEWKPREVAHDVPLLAAQ